MNGKALHPTVIKKTNLPHIVCVCIHAHSYASMCVFMCLCVRVLSECEFLCQSITVSYWHHCHFGWMSARLLWFTRSALRHKVSFPCHHKHCDCNLIHTHTQTNKAATNVVKIYTCTQHTHAYMHAQHIHTHRGITVYDFPHQKVGQLWLQHQPKMKALSGLSLAQSTFH